ncbi:MAG: GNAT family N-acetyltransferase [Actinomycetes bacterium]
MAIQVRPLAAQDKQVWDQLFDGYLIFYKTDLSSEQIALTWNRLLDPEYNSFGLVAIVDGVVLGLTHYSFQTSTWALKNYCYLEDLFVSTESRGQGIGRALIDAVLEIAKVEGSSRLYWATDKSNVTAQKLYDTYGPESGILQYRIKIINP